MSYATSHLPTNQFNPYAGVRQEAITHPGLVQLYSHIVALFNEYKEPYRIRAAKRSNCEVIRVSTPNTRHMLRFSVLDRKPDLIHTCGQRFHSVYDDKTIAGWRGMFNLDLNVGPKGLSQDTLDLVTEKVNSWMLLNADNARGAMSPFPVEPNSCVAKDSWVAASFIVDRVSINTNGGGYNIELTDASGVNHATITGERALSFNNPARLKGCAAVIHSDGEIRVLKRATFQTLYTYISSISANPTRN